METKQEYQKKMYHRSLVIRKRQQWQFIWTITMVFVLLALMARWDYKVFIERLCLGIIAGYVTGYYFVFLLGMDIDIEKDRIKRKIKRLKVKKDEADKVDAILARRLGSQKEFENELIKIQRKIWRYECKLHMLGENTK